MWLARDVRASHDVTGWCMQLLHGLGCFNFVLDIPLPPATLIGNSLNLVWIYRTMEDKTHCEYALQKRTAKMHCKNALQKCTAKTHCESVTCKRSSEKTVFEKHKFNILFSTNCRNFASIFLEQNPFHFGPKKPKTVFTTFYFFRNLRMGQIS
jgi:hypothetical protein